MVGFERHLFVLSESTVRPNAEDSHIWLASYPRKAEGRQRPVTPKPSTGRQRPGATTVPRGYWRVARA